VGAVVAGRNIYEDSEGASGTVTERLAPLEREVFKRTARHARK
jgi:hypothetical protein